MKNGTKNKLRNTACNLCLAMGEIEGIISSDEWVFNCNACKKQCMPFKKKIIYLDQNFLSSASSNHLKSEKFILLGERLQNLIHKQLIICPFSELHIIESSLAGKRELRILDYIKKISCGFHFDFSQTIIQDQLYCAYKNYSENKKKYTLSPLLVIDPYIHSWVKLSNTKGKNFATMVMNFTNPENMRKAKNFFCTFMSSNLSNWHNSTFSSKEHVDFEINSKISGYINAIQKAMNSNIEEQINCVELKEIMSIFDVLNPNTMDELKKLLSFLMSDYFRKIPYINIRAGLAALVIQELKQGKLPEKKENIEKKYRGLEFDIQHCALYAPYCDAIFTDNKMARYLRQLEEYDILHYPCEVFSTEDWEGFAGYLDKIERAMTQDMENELNYFYTWFPSKYGKGANM